MSERTQSKRSRSQRQSRAVPGASSNAISGAAGPRRGAGKTGGGTPPIPERDPAVSRDSQRPGAPPPGGGQAPEPADAIDRELDALLGSSDDSQALSSVTMSGLSWLVYLRRCEPSVRQQEVRAKAQSDAPAAGDAPDPLWRLIGATGATWRRWTERPAMQLGEALALHHHLDPARVWTLIHGVDPYDLCKEFPGVPGRALRLLLVQRVWLPVFIRARGLPCLETTGGGAFGDGPLSLTVTLEDAERFLGGTPVIQFQHTLNEVLAGSAPMAPVPPAVGAHPPAHRTALLDLLDRARELYRTVAEGGTYVPGDRRTEPDVAAFLLQGWPNGRRRSESLAAAMRTILRPEGLRRGRKPGRRISD